MGCLIVSELYTSKQLSQASDGEVMAGNRFINVAVKTFFMITAWWHGESG
jgi:hypothetical protein